MADGASPGTVEALLNQLSTVIKSDLASFQSQIFDLRELCLHCDRIAAKFQNTSYMTPFERRFEELALSIQEELEQAIFRYTGLKSDFDAVQAILLQRLADDRFSSEVALGLLSLWVTVGVAICFQCVSLYQKIRHDRKVDDHSDKMVFLSVVDALTTAFRASELRQICQRNGLDTTGTKRALALRISREMGQDRALKILEAPQYGGTG